MDSVTEETGTRATDWFGLERSDLRWAGGALALVTVAFLVPHLHIGPVTPLVHATAAQVEQLSNTAPLLARWLPHLGWGTPFAVAIGIAVAWFGPRVAAVAPWWLLVPGAWAVSGAWAMSLALIDGIQRGFGYRLINPTEYLLEVGRVHNIGRFLHHFAANAAQTGPNGWDLQVAGHPPGALLTFVELDRLGYGTREWASGFCVFVGASAAAAVLVGVKALADEATARRAAPFLAVAPTAIWIAVSADAYFAGVAAWGVALFAVAAGRRDPIGDVTAVAAGLLIGLGVYLDYGLVLLGIPLVAVLIATKNLRPLWGALAGSLTVALAFTLGGFWWFDGYQAVQHRYWAGIANHRPFVYWIWGNVASLICAIGLAAAAALPRALDWRLVRQRSGLPVLVAAFVLVVLLADLSGLSKAETERIWLPFAVWLSAAPAILTPRSHQSWLGIQVLGALLINSLLLTNW